MAKMTENSKRVLKFLQENGVGKAFTYKQVAEALDFDNTATVIGSVGGERSGLVKRGFVEKFAEEVELEDGKTKTIKKFALTEAGMNFDPDAEEEE